MLTKKKLYSWSVIYFLLVGVIFIVLLYADKTRTESGMGLLVKNMEPGLRLLFSSESVLTDESHNLISNRVFEELQGSADAEAFKLEKDGAVQMSWSRGKNGSSVNWSSSLDEMVWNFSVADLNLVLKARLSPVYKYPLYFMIAMVLFILILILSYVNSIRGTAQPEYAHEHFTKPPLPPAYRHEDHETRYEMARDQAPRPAFEDQAETLETPEAPAYPRFHENHDSYRAENPVNEHYFEDVPQEQVPVPIVNDPAQLLFDSESGVSNGDIFPYRLKKELERASENAQDLSLVYLRLEPAEIHNLKSGVKLLLEEFTHEDLIFRIDEATFALILPQLDFDQSIAHLEMLYRKLERLQNSMTPGFEHLDIMSGLSSRNGRLVEPDRLMEESRTALAKADRKKGRIVGFRPDPSKFRNYLKHTKV